MHKESVSPAPRPVRLPSADALRVLSRQSAEQGRRNPTFNAYAHVWTQLGRQAAQPTDAISPEAGVPQDPAAITRLLAAMALRPDGRPSHPSTRRQQRYIVRACYRRLREADPGPQGGSIDAE